jgi:hypothetical protein
MNERQILREIVDYVNGRHFEDDVRNGFTVRAVLKDKADRAQIALGYFPTSKRGDA